MGLFDFFRDAGDDVTKTEEVSPEQVDELRRKSILEKVAQLEIEGMQVAVTVEGDKATLTGTAPSQEALEKVVLCAGNQFGIAQVDCQMTVDTPATVSPTASTPAGSTPPGTGTAPPAAPAAEATFYTVQSGDTLSKIAKAQYGDASKYMAIFEANQPMLTDPDKIYPGQSLRLPPL